MSEQASEEAAEVEAILGFWFGELSGPHDCDHSKSPLWWQGRAEDDAAIRARFAPLVERALAGGLDAWRAEPRSCLALVILLDQFTRCLGRGSAQAFAGDARAYAVVCAAIDAGLDMQLRPVERSFFYMPLMHAEDRDAAERSLATFAALSRDIAALPVDDHPDFNRHAVQHADIVLRFGRFPHRNELLGRDPTPEEEAFLASGGPTFGQRKSRADPG